MTQESLETFEVRDLREKTKFVLDDKFFDVYVRVLGTNALGVYCALSRRADKEQKCWPAQKTIAMELNLSEPTVSEWIKVLDFFNIIKKKRIGRQCTNRYYLIDKKYWKKDFDAILNGLSTVDFKLFKPTTKTVLVKNLNRLISHSKDTQKGNTKRKNNFIIKQPLKPFYQGMSMRKRYGKWEVFDRGCWNEYGAKESEIEWK
jgi:hypothetical protein